MTLSTLNVIEATDGLIYYCLSSRLRVVEFQAVTDPAYCNLLTVLCVSNAALFNIIGKFNLFLSLSCCNHRNTSIFLQERNSTVNKTHLISNTVTEVCNLVSNFQKITKERLIIGCWTDISTENGWNNRRLERKYIMRSFTACTLHQI
jgi:hypothetical protein